MANTSELFETIRTINERLNKIVDDFDSDNASVALTHILNICEPIAYDTSFMSVYKINNDGIECAIKLIDPADNKIPPLKELAEHVSALDDYVSEFIGDDFWRHVRTKKTDEEATTKESLSSFLNSGRIDLDVMIGNIANRVNSIDAEVEAIKEHLTELGLGLDATCDNAIEDDDDGYACKDIVAIYDKLERIDDQIINLTANNDNIEVDVDEHGERLDRLSSTIEELSNRLTSIEIFNAQLCATLVQDKRFRKNFDRTAKKIRKSVKAIKHVDNTVNTDKLVPEKEIKPSEE